MLIEKNSNLRVNNSIVTVGYINYWSFQSETITFLFVKYGSPLVIDWKLGKKPNRRKALQEKIPTVFDTHVGKQCTSFQIMDKALYIMFSLLMKGLIIT